MKKRTYKIIKHCWGFLKNLFVVLATIGTIFAIITSLKSNDLSTESNKISRDALREAKKSNTLAKATNSIAENALEVSERSNDLANEANEISREISGITNRPYVLYDPVGFTYGDMQQNKKKKWLDIFYNFRLLNNGTLPAWVFKYDFYVSIENNEPIRVPFGPQDKPTANFSIGAHKHIDRAGNFYLGQKIINDPANHVDNFLSKQNKFILLITKYRALGDKASNELFTYWELFIFDANKVAWRVECGTDNLDENSVRELFIKQDKIFRDNNAV